MTQDDFVKALRGFKFSDYKLLIEHGYLSNYDSKLMRISGYRVLKNFYVSTLDIHLQAGEVIIDELLEELIAQEKLNDIDKYT